MATVAAAVIAAQAAHRDVYVAAGTYDGKVSIIGEKGHIGIYGGYDPSTWARSAANVTTLEGPHEAVTVAGDGCPAAAAFKIHLNPRKTQMKSATLTLDGHRLKLVKGKRRWTARVDLSHSNRPSHTLTIRGKLQDGRSFKQTRHYRTCAR
jgi:hypothetical protein